MVCLCEIFATLSKTVFFYSLNWVPKSYILLECIDVYCVYLYQRFVVITDSLRIHISYFNFKTTSDVDVENWFLGELVSEAPLIKPSLT